MRVEVAVIVGVLVGGCYDSTITGDVGTPDVVEDTIVDTVTEADVPAEVVVDMGPDSTVVCPMPDPAPDGPSLHWEVDDDPWPYEEVNVVTPCRVSAIVGEEVGHTIIELICGSGAMMTPHRVEIFAEPTAWMALGEGDEVMFEYQADPIWWVNRWFAIRDFGGNLLIGGVDAARMSPEWGDTGWYSPLEVSAVGGMCTPDEEMCGLVERQALSITYWDSSELVFDSTYASVGMLATAQVIVDSATNFLEMDCDDVPDSFYTALFVLPPEG